MKSRIMVLITLIISGHYIESALPASSRLMPRLLQRVSAVPTRTPLRFSSLQSIAPKNNSSWQDKLRLKWDSFKNNFTSKFYYSPSFVAIRQYSPFRFLQESLLKRKQARELYRKNYFPNKEEVILITKNTLKDFHKEIKIFNEEYFAAGKNKVEAEKAIMSAAGRIHGMIKLYDAQPVKTTVLELQKSVFKIKGNDFLQKLEKKLFKLGIPLRLSYSNEEVEALKAKRRLKFEYDLCRNIDQVEYAFSSIASLEQAYFNVKEYYGIEDLYNQLTALYDFIRNLEKEEEESIRKYPILYGEHGLSIYQELADEWIKELGLQEPVLKDAFLKKLETDFKIKKNLDNDTINKSLDSTSRLRLIQDLKVSNMLELKHIRKDCDSTQDPESPKFLRASFLQKQYEEWIRELIELEGKCFLEQVAQQRASSSENVFSKKTKVTTKEALKERMVESPREFILKVDNYASIDTVVRSIINRMQNASRRLTQQDIKYALEEFLNDRKIIFKLHPDLIGGNGEEIKVFNNLREALKKSNWNDLF